MSPADDRSRDRTRRRRPGNPVAGLQDKQCAASAAVLGLLRCFGRAVLFDRSADVRHDIGAGRLATESNRFAISLVHLTANGSGLNTLLPKRTPRPSAADRSEPIVTAPFKQASWASERMSSTMSAPPWRPSATKCAAAPDAMRPDAGLRHPGSPMEGSQRLHGIGARDRTGDRTRPMQRRRRVAWLSGAPSSNRGSRTPRCRFSEWLGPGL